MKLQSIAKIVVLAVFTAGLAGVVWASAGSQASSANSERGAGDYNRILFDEGNARTMILENFTGNPGPFTISSDEQILVKTIRATGLLEAEVVEIVVIDVSQVQFLLHAVNSRTQEFHFDPPFMLTTGKEVLIRSSTSNAAVIEFRGTPIASSTNRSETMTVR